MKRGEETVRRRLGWGHVACGLPTTLIEGWRKPFLEVAIAFRLSEHPSPCRVEEGPGIVASAGVNGVRVGQRLFVAGSGLVLEVAR